MKMEKRSKNKYGGFCCWGRASSDAKGESVYSIKELAPATSKPHPTTRQKELRQQMAATQRSLAAILTKIEMNEMKQRLNLEMISECFVNDVVERSSFYTRASVDADILKMAAKVVTAGACVVKSRALFARLQNEMNAIASQGQPPFTQGQSPFSDNGAVSLLGEFGTARIHPAVNEAVRDQIDLWELKTINVSGKERPLQQFQDVRCIFHQDILSTLSFTTRITLRDIMIRYTFDETHARFLCINLLEGLKYLHSLNMVHGQITPSNVVFTDTGYPCLTGFDQFKRKTTTQTPKVPLRVEYSSPEQINDEAITAATDVFQVGLITYFLLYSRSPFIAETYQQTKSNVLDKKFKPEFKSGTLSKEGRHFIQKLLKTMPDKRFKLDKCKKTLVKAVKWFKNYSGEELYTQTYTSPFKDFIQANMHEE